MQKRSKLGIVFCIVRQSLVFMWMRNFFIAHGHIFKIIEINDIR